MRMPLAPPSPRTALRRVLKAGRFTARGLVKPVALTTVAHGLHLLQGNLFVGTIDAARTQSGKRGGRALLAAGSVTGVELVAQNARRRAWRHTALEFRDELRTALIDSIAEQDLAFFDDHGTGNLLNLITEDTQRVSDLIEQLPDQLIEKAMTGGFAAVTLVRVSPRFTVIAAAPLALLAVPSVVLGSRLASRYAEAGSMRGDYSQALESLLAGITDIKLFQAEPRVAARLRKAGQRMNSANFDAFSLATTSGLLTQAIGAGAFALVTAQGGGLVRSGRITSGQFARILYLYPNLLAAVADLQGLMGTYQEAADAARRIAKVLDHQPLIVGGTKRLAPGDIGGRLALEDVSFAYDESRAVLQGISFEIGRGEMVAIVGRTGSGKSTLLRLMARLYEAEGGRITLDGVDLRDLSLADLRKAISLVSQETYLFEGSIRDNLRYGDPGADDDALRTAMKQAGAADLLGRLPDGLDAQVGERGGHLSGGERQRVAIARTILRGSPVLLLDEITSHLDYETEDMIRRTIDGLAPEKTLVVVTHRLATIRNATRIVVMEQGRVAETGTHDELIEEDGIYARLWKLQTGGEPPPPRRRPRKRKTATPKRTPPTPPE